MRITGNTSHWEEEVRTGQRNAARGKAGARTKVSERPGLSREAPLPVFLILRRDLCSDGEGPAIIGVTA